MIDFAIKMFAIKIILIRNFILKVIEIDKNNIYMEIDLIK